MENNLESADAFNSPTPSSEWSRSHTPEVTSYPHDNRYPNILFLDTVRVAKSFRCEAKPPIPEIPQPPTLPTLPAVTSSLSPEQPRKRVPRPPNAFMLYRSDWLKQNHIPSTVERRQQALSCVAGECWNMLPPEEKQKWQAKAAEAYRVHQLKYPDYKFSPAPKGSGRKGKGKSEVSDSAVRALREKYVHMTGPAVPSTRRRRGRKVRNVAGQRDDLRSDAETVSEPSHTPSLTPAMVPAPTPLYPYAVAESGEGATLPSDFPSPSLPYYFQDRRHMLSAASPAMGTTHTMDSYFSQLPARPMSVPLLSDPSDMEFHHHEMGGFDMASFSQDGNHFAENYDLDATQSTTGEMPPLQYAPSYGTLNSGNDEQPFQSPLLPSENGFPHSPSSLYQQEGVYPCSDVLVYPEYSDTTYDN
ncbi:hypothetical protein PM082_005367 [Marasmius tenuissimus]|nr:hypothetical protein PM082_005367 [Marasmius tenuissimus]